MERFCRRHGLLATAFLLGVFGRANAQLSNTTGECPLASESTAPQNICYSIIGRFRWGFRVIILKCHNGTRCFSVEHACMRADLNMHASIALSHRQHRSPQKVQS
jgi:hypothetical protein